MLGDKNMTSSSVATTWSIAFEALDAIAAQEGGALVSPFFPTRLVVNYEAASFFAVTNAFSVAFPQG
jgi:hypothetical protein